MRGTFISLAICAGLVACGTSPPIQYYVLDTVHPVAAPADGIAAPVRVAVVRIPPDLDRQEIVRESAATQLTVSDQHRWAAPLDEMMARVLAQDLADRLPSGMVILPREPAPAHVNDLVVNVLEFARDPSGTVTFDGSWTLVPNGSDTELVHRRIRVSKNAQSPGYNEQVRAMSRLLGVLSDSIVASLPSATATRNPRN